MGFPVPALPPMSYMALEHSRDLSETGKGFKLAELCWIRDNVDKVLSEVPDMQSQKDD